MALSSTLARTPALQAGKLGSTPGRVTKWGMGLLEVVICLANRKSDRFESDILHHIFYKLQDRLKVGQQTHYLFILVRLQVLHPIVFMV